MLCEILVSTRTETQCPFVVASKHSVRGEWLSVRACNERWKFSGAVGTDSARSAFSSDSLGKGVVDSVRKKISSSVVCVWEMVVGLFHQIVKEGMNRFCICDPELSSQLKHNPFFYGGFAFQLVRGGEQA